MSVGLFELAILLFIVFLIMGPKRITNLGRDEKNELTEEEDPDRQPRKK